MSTPEPSIAFRDLLAYTDYLAQRWLAYFRQHPAALDVDVGAKTGSIRHLVGHIVQVEQYFADRLNDRESSPPQKLEKATVEELERLHQDAHQRLGSYIASTTEDALRETRTFGPVTVSKRKILTQTVLHSIHHWAQVAMEVRQAGFPTDKPQDIIISPVME
jgi:uncharacterized damage-inducible protein DinB